MDSTSFVAPSHSAEVANINATANHSNFSKTGDVEMSDINIVEAFDARKAVDVLAAPFLAKLPTIVPDVKRVNPLALKFRKAGKEGLVVDIKQEEIGNLNLVLYKICSVEMTPVVQSQFNAKHLLEAIKNPQIYFPQQYQKIAAALLDEFEATNWGAPQSPTIDSIPTVNGALRGQSTSAYSGPARQFKPDQNDPVWMNDGIMHHIIKKINAPAPGQRKAPVSFRIDPDYTPKPAKVFGHNGLKIGDCWPSQLTALRDGAHGSSQAGIHGNPEAGCFSIIVSGGYTDINQDLGDKIWYSDPTAKKTDLEMSGKDSSSGRKALERSLDTGRPVRILRTHKTEWFGKPSIGCRYDGLYRITTYKERQRANAQGKFKVFCFERLGDQEPIDVNRPTRKEQQIFANVHNEF